MSAPPGPDDFTLKKLFARNQDPNHTLTQIHTPYKYTHLDIIINRCNIEILWNRSFVRGRIWNSLTCLGYFHHSKLVSKKYYLQQAGARASNTFCHPMLGKKKKRRGTRLGKTGEVFEKGEGKPWTWRQFWIFFAFF